MGFVTIAGGALLSIVLGSFRQAIAQRLHSIFEVLLLPLESVQRRLRRFYGAPTSSDGPTEPAVPPPSTHEEGAPAGASTRAMDWTLTRAERYVVPAVYLTCAVLLVLANYSLLLPRLRLAFGLSADASGELPGPLAAGAVVAALTSWGLLLKQSLGLARTERPASALSPADTDEAQGSAQRWVSLVVSSVMLLGSLAAVGGLSWSGHKSVTITSINKPGYLSEIVERNYRNCQRSERANGTELAVIDEICVPPERLAPARNWVANASLVMLGISAELALAFAVGGGLPMLAVGLYLLGLFAARLFGFVVRVPAVALDLALAAPVVALRTTESIMVGSVQLVGRAGELCGTGVATAWNSTITVLTSRVDEDMKKARPDPSRLKSMQHLLMSEPARTKLKEARAELTEAIDLRKEDRGPESDDWHTVDGGNRRNSR